MSDRAPRRGCSWTVFAPDGSRLSAQEHLPPRDPDPDAPTVVLAHGWTLTRASWEPVVAALQRTHAVRVVTYDEPEHGGSSAGASRPTVPGLAADLDAVLRAVAPSGPVVLGGHSMGGMAVLAWTGRHAGEVADRVRGVVLVSTSAGDLVPRPARHGRRGHHAGRGPTGPGPALLGALVGCPPLPWGLLVAPTSQRRLLFGAGADPADVRAVCDQMAGTTLRATGRYGRALVWHDETAGLGALAGVPVRVLVGERDRLTPPRHARRLHAGLPGSTLDVLPGRGHMLTYEASAEVAAAIAAVLPPPA